LKINEDIKIEAVDSRNICILKRANTEGEETWKRLGYYSTPQGALKGLVNREVIGTGLKDFETVCSKIEEIYKYIDSLNIKIEIPVSEDEITISKDEYEGLLESEKKLNALKDSGVEESEDK